MTEIELTTLLPKQKTDTTLAQVVVALGYPAVDPVLPQLLEWLQDINWPVAQVIAPFLVRVGAPLYPHLRRILESDDHIWKYYVLQRVVADSPELQELLITELERIAQRPEPGELREEVDEVARKILVNRRR